MLIDELGKGTEVSAGAALAGAIIEELDASKCRAIFATHLHSLFDMNLTTPRLKEMYMKTKRSEDGSRITPALKLACGRSTESLAMVVARDCGLPEEIVSRAEELYDRVRNMRSARAPVEELGTGEGVEAATDQMSRAATVLRSTVADALSCDEVRHRRIRERKKKVKRRKRTGSFSDYKYLPVNHAASLLRP